MKPSLTIVKIVLTVASIVSIGTALGATIYFGVLKNSPPVAVQPTPSITQVLTPTVTPTLIPTITPNIDTSDWKTYKNEKYGYEIKYPSEWQGGEESSVAKVASFTPEKRDMAQAGFWVYLYENPENLSTKDWWVKDYKKGDAKYTYKGIIRFSEINMDVYKEESGLEFQYYISSKNSNIYLIVSPLVEEKMNQILSTFKFTEK